MGLHTIGLNNISLNDNNFGNKDPETIINVRLLAWCNKDKQCKVCKKEIDKEWMPIAWQPRRRWDWYISEDEKKKYYLWLIKIILS